jgi:long-chain fatty acid transport protein
MRRIVIGAVGLVASAGSAGALGLDRSGQDISAIFEPGGFAEVTYALANPTLEGFDLFGNDIEDVGEEFSFGSFAVKYDTAPGLSLALIVDQPYGADILYGGSPATTLLGGTAAELDSVSTTTLVRYRFNDAFSIHGGVRSVNTDANVTLSGVAFGGLNGYNVDLDDGEGYGYVIGGAYERPDIALRVALTYSTEVDLEFDAVESVGGTTVAVGTTTVTAPESFNLDFQTGIARDTLLFGQIRHAAYSATILSPDFFGGATGGGSITDIEDGTSYSIGIGRRFTDSFSGLVSIGYEPETGDDLVSPLAPSNGQTSVQVGGAYTVGALTFSGGVRYTMLGDANPEVGTPDTQVATFEDGDAVSLGLSVAYRF